MRERERKDDEADRDAELRELEEIELEKEREAEREAERLREEAETQERMKLKRFMEMQEQISKKQDDEEPARKRQKLGDLSPEAKQAQLERIKALYQQLPKSQDALYKYEIDWESLFANEVITKICTPWIGKKILDLMGVEEPTMITIVVRLLQQKCSQQQLLNKITNILDDAAPEFVEKLWKVIVFEDMKIKDGIYS